MYKTLFSSEPVINEANNMNMNYMNNPTVDKPLINSKKIGLSIKNLSSFDIIKFIIVSTVTFILPRLLWEFYYKNFDPQNPPLRKLLTFLSGKNDPQQQQQQQHVTRVSSITPGEIKNFEVKPVFNDKKESEIIMDNERSKKSYNTVSETSSYCTNEPLPSTNNEIILPQKRNNSDTSSLNQDTLVYRGKENTISRGIDEDNSISIKALVSNITNNIMPLPENKNVNSTEYVLGKYRGIIEDCEEMVNNFILSDALTKPQLFKLLEPLNNSIKKTENFFLTNRNLTIVVVGRKAQGKSRLIDAVFREDCELIDESIGSNISVSIILYIYTFINKNKN